MRILGILCLCSLLCSCEWFESQESKTSKLVEAEMREINWNEVDQYPLFENCDESVSKQEQRNCFETTLLQHFANTLKDFEFILEDELDETIYVDFLVDREGSMSVLDIEKHPALQQQIPEFNAIITQSLKSLPKVGPALKRGIPVNAKFRIPLVMKTP